MKFTSFSNSINDFFLQTLKVPHRIWSRVPSIFSKIKLNQKIIETLWIKPVCLFLAFLLCKLSRFHQKLIPNPRNKSINSCKIMRLILTIVSKLIVLTINEKRVIKRCPLGWTNLCFYFSGLVWNAWCKKQVNFKLCGFCEIFDWETMWKAQEKK